MILARYLSSTGIWPQIQAFISIRSSNTWYSYIYIIYRESLKISQFHIRVSTVGLYKSFFAALIALFKCLTPSVRHLSAKQITSGTE